jgi:hypothetical protein
VPSRDQRIVFALRFLAFERLYEYIVKFFPLTRIDPGFCNALKFADLAIDVCRRKVVILIFDLRSTIVRPVVTIARYRSGKRYVETKTTSGPARRKSARRLSMLSGVITAWSSTFLLNSLASFARKVRILDSSLLDLRFQVLELASSAVESFPPDLFFAS